MIKYVLMEWVGKWKVCDPDPGHSPLFFDTPEDALNFAQMEFSNDMREEDVRPGEAICDLWVYEQRQERYGLVYPEGAVLAWAKHRFRAVPLQLPPDLIEDDTGQYVEVPF